MAVQDQGFSAMPSTFVESMRILFDIMDEKRRGVVKLADIESRWSGDRIILECLRSVASASGGLTFERFCAALQICLKTTSGNGKQPMPPPKPPRLNPQCVMGIPNVPDVGQSSAKRREPRRHTLQNGIDYNRLKRLKQLEQERTLLQQTLGTVTETRNWLSHKLQSVNEQIRHVGRSTAPLESSTNHHQERLVLKRAHAAEIHRTLVCLVNNYSCVDDSKNNFLQLNLETQWSNHQERNLRQKQDNRQMLEEDKRVNHQLQLMRQMK